MEWITRQALGEILDSQMQTKTVRPYWEGGEEVSYEVAKDWTVLHIAINENGILEIVCEQPHLQEG